MNLESVQRGGTSNIIDRSPLKTSAHEALWSQSTRRMNEAKTAEEKASVVQKFAEQLRLEKLRNKRLQENMRELDNAISSPTHAAGNHNTANPAIGGGTSIGLLRQQKGNQEPVIKTTWSNMPPSQFDLFRNGTENGNALGSAIKSGGQISSVGNVGSRSASNTAFDPTQRRFSDDGVPLSSMAAVGASTMGPQNPYPAQHTLSPSSRPLNVNAAPFVARSTISSPSVHSQLYQSKIENAPSSFGQLPLDSGLQRVNVPPPTSQPIVAVATKANQDALQYPTQVPMDGRSRSSSIGSHQDLKFNRLPQVISVLRGLTGAGNCRGNSADLVLQPTAPGLFSQLKQNSDIPRSQYPPTDMPKPRPLMGTVTIDLTAPSAGGSLLKGEDWDAEYAQQQVMPEVPPKREMPPHCIQTPGDRTSSKDWLSVLKERDDMAKRRYSREVMLRLTSSEWSKVRPVNLSSDYNNDAGLWSPDLWFHMNFQNSQPQPVWNRNKPGFNTGSGALSVDSMLRQRQDPNSDMRRISCLVALQQNVQEEHQKKKEGQMSMTSNLQGVELGK